MKLDTAEAIEAGKLYFVYEKVVWVDAVVSLIHVIYAILSGNGLSWLMFIGVRVPRLALHMLSKHYKTIEWKGREYTFRKYSVYGYFPAALIVTLLAGSFYVCNSRNIFWKATKGCYMGYVVCMIILLVVHTFLDFYIFKKIVEPELLAIMPEYEE